MQRYTERYKSHHSASAGLKKAYKINVDKEEYLSNILTTKGRENRVLYIHVPFCNKICSFCPFNKPVGLKRSTYDDYIIEEINNIKDYEYLKKPFKAINFGGGTPTTLKPHQMDKVLKHIHKSFNIAENAEISLETTVSELTDEMIDVFIKNGVNRLSVGIQSFDDSIRKIYNRRGSGDFAIERLKKVIDSGIVNTSVDLIYNAPNQRIRQLEKDLEKIAKLDLAGISFYSLRLHPKTPLYNMLGEYDIIKMNDLENEKKFFVKILEYLKPYGYEVFELTKLIRNKIDKYEYVKVRHNEGECIPLGHGSGGNFGAYLYRNLDEHENISSNIKIKDTGIVVDEEYFILDKLIYEMQSGAVDFRKYSEKLGLDLKKTLSNLLQDLENDKLIIQNDNGFTMTNDGLFWGNNIINEIIQVFLKVTCKI